MSGNSKNKPLRNLALSTLPHQSKSESLLSFVDNVTALLKWLRLQAEFFVKGTWDTRTIITRRPISVKHARYLLSNWQK